MALNKGQLKTKIISLLDELKDEENQTASIEKFATELSDAIDEYVKTAEVIGTDSQGGSINGSLI